MTTQDVQAKLDGLINKYVRVAVHRAVPSMFIVGKLRKTEGPPPVYAVHIDAGAPAVAVATFMPEDVARIARIEGDYLDTIYI